MSFLEIVTVVLAGVITNNIVLVQSIGIFPFWA